MNINLTGIDWGLNFTEPMGFQNICEHVCVFPAYDMWILINFVCLITILLDEKLHLVARFCRESGVSDGSREEGIIKYAMECVLLAVNITMFMIHFGVEPIVRVLAIC